jgi:iron complex outermembrane receptor protein
MTALLKFDKGELLLRGDYSHMGGITTNALPTSNFYSNYTTNTVNPTYIANGQSNDQLLTLTPRRRTAFTIWPVPTICAATMRLWHDGRIQI